MFEIGAINALTEFVLEFTGLSKSVSPFLSAVLYKYLTDYYTWIIAIIICIKLSSTDLYLYKILSYIGYNKYRVIVYNHKILQSLTLLYKNQPDIYFDECYDISLGNKFLDDKSVPSKFPNKCVITIDKIRYHIKYTFEMLNVSKGTGVSDIRTSQMLEITSNSTVNAEQLYDRISEINLIYIKQTRHIRLCYYVQVKDNFIVNEFINVTKSEWEKHRVNCFSTWYNEKSDEIAQLVYKFEQNQNQNNIFQPNRLCWLLLGDKGVGKSSLIHRIAIYLRRNIHYINLTLIRTIDDLNMLLGKIHFNESSCNTIVVFEEFDSMVEYITEDEKLTEKTDKTTRKFTIKDLQIIIQGYPGINNSIWFSTSTNLQLPSQHPELFRPGRFLPICLKYCTVKFYKSKLGINSTDLSTPMTSELVTSF